eukprot:TRINITY_DN4725_c0_g1_i1.p1 TRINITY_DN4725_c0_g1~~TRINITY_DN4725_c0_g1_i1.p1  ORF type:complete len:172 (-),score=40.97 TRINITY_DN4725_c0_g1_i1:101-616(-)
MCSDSDYIEVNWKDVDTDKTNIFIGASKIPKNPEPVIFKDRKLTLNSITPEEFISKRIGPSKSTVKYVSNRDSITLANLIFGSGNWSTKILDVEKVSEVESANGMYKVSYSCKTRVCAVVHDKIVCHEAIDFGSAFDRQLESAQANALKTSQTRAMKKALERFGRVFIPPL